MQNDEGFQVDRPDDFDNVLKPKALQIIFRALRSVPNQLICHFARQQDLREQFLEIYEMPRLVFKTDKGPCIRDDPGFGSRHSFLE